LNNQSLSSLPSLSLFWISVGFLLRKRKRKGKELNYIQLQARGNQPKYIDANPVGKIAEKSEGVPFC